MKLTAEEFLREKLASEISNFGDGTTEFHTRDIEHLLKCLDEKDDKIKEVQLKCDDLANKVHFDAEMKLKELLEDVMPVSNWSADERLYYIRQQYKDVYDKIKTTY